MRPRFAARRAALTLTAAATALAGTTLLPGSAGAAEIPVGRRQLFGHQAGMGAPPRPLGPGGTSGPVNSAGSAVTPRVTDAAADRPVPTNDWWSSLVFKRYADNPYPQPMFGHPLSYRAVAGGLEIGYPTEPTVVGEGRQTRTRTPPTSPSASPGSTPPTPRSTTGPTGP